MVKGSDNDKILKVKIGENTKKKKKKSGSSSAEEIKLKKGRRTTGSTPAKKERTKSNRVRTLDPLREQLSVLVEQANERVRRLEDMNYDRTVQGKKPLVSRAQEEAIRSMMRQSKRVGDDVLFRADLTTRREINREFARVHAFLNDYTSTPEGANDFKSKLSTYKGAFGSQWQDEYGERYDKSRIDSDKASLAFDIYRRVVEAAGGWERAVGIFQGKESLIGYGSENLIIAIYDMVDNLDIANFANEEDRRDFIVARGLDFVSSGIKAYEEMAAKQVSDYDYGIVFDDETAKARREWFAFLFDNRNKIRRD